MASRPYRIRNAPTAPGHPLLGSIPGFLRDPLSTFIEGWTQCGDVVFFRLVGPLDRFLLAHPEHVKYALHDNQDNYPKDPQQIVKFRAFAGQGLTTADPPIWRRQRPLMNPTFEPRHVESFLPAIVETTEETLRRWRILQNHGQGINISEEMFRLSLNIVVRALFTATAGNDADHIVRAGRLVFDRAYQDIKTYYGLPKWLPLPAMRRWREAKRTLDNFAHGLIHRRRSAGAEYHDLLSVLLNARDEHGENISDEQVRDEIVTMMLAGHTNIGLTLIWTFILLSRHPEIRLRVRDETGGALDGRTPDLESLAKLAYTKMVLKEAMRLYPPVWALARKARNDDVIGGYHIPAGSSIFFSPYITHRHPAFWDNPEGFRPERFESEPRGANSEFAFLPFGIGPRRCIGEHLALLATPIVLAMVTQHFRLDLAPGEIITPEAAVMLRPGDVMMTLGEFSQQAPQAGTTSA